MDRMDRKQYRIKLKKFITYPIYGEDHGPDKMVPGEALLKLQSNNKYQWLYGEETERGINLFIPYPLSIVEFVVCVPKDLVEEVHVVTETGYAKEGIPNGQ